MEDLPAIAQGGIGAALAIAAAIAWLLVRRALARREAADAGREKLETELRDAENDWLRAEYNGDAARMHAAKRRMDRLRRLLGRSAALVGVLLLSSCRTAPEEAPRAVVLSEHCRTAAPGDTVPELPAGDTRWWLCTSTGLRLLLPDDSHIPDGGLTP